MTNSHSHKPFYLTRKAILIYVLLVLGGLIAAGLIVKNIQNPHRGAQKGFLITRNSKYGYSIQYPEATWALAKDSFKEKGNAATLLSTKNTASGQNAYFVIAVATLDTPHQTLDDTYKLALRGSGEMAPDFKVLDEKDLSFAGTSAKAYDTSATTNKHLLKIRNKLLIHNQKVYLLSYTTLSDRFDLFSDQANEIFNTFQWL